MLSGLLSKMRGAAGKAQAQLTKVDDLERIALAAGGAIVLAAWDDDFNLVAVSASLVGQNGVEPGVAYRLTAAGEFEAVES